VSEGKLSRRGASDWKLPCEIEARIGSLEMNEVKKPDTYIFHEATAT
jgi:hypothetical protein